MTIRTYERYRDSGVPWLGEVPNHWSCKRIKQTAYVKGRVGWKGLTSNEFLEVGYAHLVTGTDFRAKFIDWDECYCVDQTRFEDDPFIQLRNGDLLITKDGTIGKLAIVSGLTGHACLNSGIFLVRPDDCLLAQYLYWVLCSEVFSHFCDLLSTGSTIQHLYQNAFENFSFAVPSISEQMAIAAFLDWETAKIDALVDEQKRLIELLKEKRQAVISHAVTKGLNPDTPMEDSGEQWIGQIPAYWEHTTAGRYVTILSGYPFPSASFSQDETETKLLRGVNVGVGKIRWDDTVYWHLEGEDGLKEFGLSIGDVVLGMDRPWINEGIRLARIGEADVPSLLLQRVASLRTHDRLEKEYLFLLLSSENFRHFCAPDMTGVSVPHISPSQVANFPIPLPPLAEQRAIAASVSEQARRLESLVLEAETAIHLLQERRSALISAAVTGRIDVREQVRQQVAAE